MMRSHKALGGKLKINVLKQKLKKKEMKGQSQKTKIQISEQETDPN